MYTHLNQQEISQRLLNSESTQVDERTLGQTHCSDQHYDIEPIPYTPNQISFEMAYLDYDIEPISCSQYFVETTYLDYKWIYDILKN